MQVVDKTKEELVTEVAQLRQRIAEMEASERERKQVEEALKRSEQEKTAIFNSISEHVVLQDPRMRVLWANRAAGESVGADPQQLVGRHCYEIWQQRRKPCVGCPVVKARQSDQPQEAEMTTADGRVWFIRGYPVRDTAGNITGAVEVTLEITDRKQAEETLKQSEKTYRDLFNLISDAVYVIDQETGQVLDVNEAACKMYGYTREEWLKMKNTDVSAEPAETQKATKETPKAIAIRYHKKKDGTVFPLDMTLSTFDLKGRKTIIVTARDITDRKQAEEALREAAEQYRILTNTSMDGFAKHDLDGRILDVNKAYCLMLGYSEEELRKMTVADIEIKKTPDEIKRQVKKVMKDGSDRFETRHRRKDGCIIDVEVSMTFLHQSGHVLVFLRDITDRKRAEEELQERESNLKKAQQIAHFGSWVWDVGTNCVEFSDEMFNIFGITKEQFVGTPEYTKNLIMTEDREKVQGCYDDLLIRHKPVSMEYSIVRPDGSIRHLWGNGEIESYKAGKPERIIGTVLDITERKQIEETLRQNEERYRFLFENTQTINILLGTDGKILDVNENAAESLGYKKKNIIGKEVLEFVIPDQRETVAQQLALELRGEYTPPLEIDIITKKGTRTLLFTEGHATLFEKGELTGMLLSAVDITERRKAEDELRVKDNAIASSINAIAIGEFGGNLTYVNPTFLKMWGYDDEKEVLGTPAIAFWDEKEKAQEVIEALLKGENVVGELKAKRKDGSLFDVQLSASTVTDETGQPICMMGSFVDITERKQTEEALRKSEERFRTIFETAQDFIFLKDSDSKFTAVNPAMERLYDVPASKLIGKTGAALFGKEMAARLREKDLRVLSGEIIVEEHPSPLKGKTDIHHIIKVPIRNSAGESIGLCGIGRDITERKQMEEALRESEEKYRLLVDNIDLGIILIDAEHTILMANASVGKRWGKPVSAIIGKKCFQVFEHCDTVCPDCPGVQTLATGQPAEVEHEEVQDDQGRFHVRLQSFPNFGQDGTVVGFTEIAEDITERKETEEALKKSEESYRLLSENIPVAVYSALPDEFSTTLFLSGRFLELTGYPSEHLLKNPEFWTSILHPEDRDYVWEKIEEHRQKKKLLEVEYRIITKNNKIKWIRDRATPVFDKHGAIVRIDGFMEDITQRKQVEKALRESEEKYRSLVESSEDPIYLVDRNCNYIFLNNRHLSRLGVQSDHVIGRPYDKFHSPKGSKDFAQCVKTVVKTGQSLSYEYQSQRDNRYFIRTLSPVKKPASSEIAAITVISKDITDLKQAEETLREREAFNYALFHYNPVETIVVDTKGRVTAFNLAKEKSGDRLPTIGDLMYKDYAAKHEIDMRAELMKYIKSGEIKKFPEQKYGDKYLTITISPFSQGAIIISEDITERKRAEELLQKERDTFYTLLEKAPYGVMVVDNDGKHTFLNPEFTNITGYTIEDIPTTQEWLHRAYPDQHYRSMVKKTWDNDYNQSKAEETFRKKFGRVFARAFKLKCKDGTAKEIEFRTAVIADEGTIFMLSDVTDRQKMHDLLETAVAEWRTTFDAISDAVCLLDSHGKIIRCNNAMLQLVEKPFNHITNHHCWEVMHGVSEAPNSCPIALTRKTNHRETEVMFKDSCWFNISVDPLLDEEGNFIGGVHIMSDITDRMRIQNELQDSREQLRNLTVYLQSVREQERTNIAREIHDELAQALTALKMDVSWLDRRLPVDAQSLSEKTESMSKLIDNTIQTVKRIAAELRPGILDDLGLVAAIEWQTEEFQNRTGISCHVTVDPQDLAVDQDCSTAIFRILQETLVNVARHAHATKVAVGLKERAGKLTLRVRDNGTGITEEQISNPQSFGLIGMRERMHPWGGKVNIKGIPGKGTTVVVNVRLGHSKKDIEKIEANRSPS